MNTALVALAGWVLLLALGYFVAPSLARSLLATQLGKALGRDVAIERVAINPLDLSVDVLGLSIKDQAGAEQLGFAQLHVDLSSASVTQTGIVVDQIHLRAPRVAVTRLADGRYDISDWLDRWASRAETDSGPLPRFSLNNIQITDGQLVFDDRPKGVRHTAEAVTFSLPFISSLPYKADVFVLPALSAVVDGSPLPTSVSVLHLAKRLHFPRRLSASLRPTGFRYERSLWSSLRRAYSNSAYVRSATAASAAAKRNVAPLTSGTSTGFSSVTPNWNDQTHVGKTP